MKPSSFARVKPEDLRINPFHTIGEGWMLITAGTAEDFNTMTANWGALGVLWGKPVALCFVRPSRHTFDYLNRSACFTLSFFDESHRAILDYCGTHSGRRVNKVAETGLKPIVTAEGGIAFEQARLILVCRRLYAQDIDPRLFSDPSTLGHYEHSDYHRMFVGEVVECLVAERGLHDGRRPARDGRDVPSDRK